MCLEGFVRNPKNKMSCLFVKKKTAMPTPQPLWTTFPTPYAYAEQAKAFPTMYPTAMPTVVPGTWKIYRHSGHAYQWNAVNNFLLSKKVMDVSAPKQVANQCAIQCHKNDNCYAWQVVPNEFLPGRPKAAQSNAAGAAGGAGGGAAAAASAASAARYGFPDAGCYMFGEGIPEPTNKASPDFWTASKFREREHGWDSPHGKHYWETWDGSSEMNDESAAADSEEEKHETGTQKLDLLLMERLNPLWVKMLKDAARTDSLSVLQLTKRLVARNRIRQIVEPASLEAENLFAPPHGGWPTSSPPSKDRDTWGVQLIKHTANPTPAPGKGGEKWDPSAEDQKRIKMIKEHAEQEFEEAHHRIPHKAGR
jgi:hypothetical protein